MITKIGNHFTYEKNGGNAMDVMLPVKRKSKNVKNLVSLEYFHVKMH